MSLWDAESRIKQMVRLIEQEAGERAATIISDARQRMEREKNKVYAAERERVLRELEERAESHKLSQRLEKSHKVNEVRLEVQRHREKLMDEMLGEARQSLLEKVKDAAAYSRLLADLVLEGLLRLLESEVRLVVRSEDVVVAQQLLPAIAERYREFAAERGLGAREVALSVVADRHLAEEDIGGAMLYCHGSRICLNNTLKARLELSFAQLAPVLRRRLFPSLCA